MERKVRQRPKSASICDEYAGVVYVPKEFIGEKFAGFMLKNKRKKK